MILRTAATRSEVRPRISPISSGVGTGLPMTWALMYPLYDSSGQPGGNCAVEHGVVHFAMTIGRPHLPRVTCAGEIHDVSLA